ncbi:MAG: M3 family oligoendopeptidase [Clostridium sp.]|nr:M3 family oligoendopeptidase [Clostridium sp.]
MELNWSLDELYKSITSEEFKRDFNKIDELIKELKKLTESFNMDNKNALNSVEMYLTKYLEYLSFSDKLWNYLALRTAVNTNDEEAMKYLDMINSKITEVVVVETKFNKYISSLENIQEYINKSALLKRHEFYMKEIISNSKYLLSEAEENIIAKMRETGSVAWLKLRDNLMSNLTVDIEENGVVKEKPYTEVVNMAYSQDKEVRKKAYEAELKSYKKVEDGMVACLNGIKGEVINVSKLRGYKSPLDMTIIQSRMDMETLDAMFVALKESLPAFRKYLRKKAEMLGYKNGLPFYELYAPVSDANMKFSYKEATEFIIKNFQTFSDDLANFAKNAVDNAWIDVMPKKGKSGGAFCCGIHSIGESRILTNFDGNFGSVVTIAHELGHGYHDYCLKDESIVTAEYPMPIAETASTFCETIIKKAALKDATKEEALSILETEISDCTQVIVDIYSRFLFEDAVFKAREKSSITVEDAKRFMIEAQKEAYGDGLDPEYLHPYMWAMKSHYYDAEANYYNFPYAFGLLFAKGLYGIYLEKGEKFTTEYKELLNATGNNNLIDVAKIVGIDLHDTNFWRKSLKVVEEDINEFLKI